MPRRTLLLSAALLIMGLLSNVGWAKNPAYSDPKMTDADFPFQGEYVGEVQGDNGEAHKLGVQVIALGEGKFHSVGYAGGLPGDGSDGEHKKEADGTLKDGAVTLESTEGKGTIRNGELMVETADGKVRGTLKKVERKSPTLGQEAPKEAIVLFDGKTADAWEGGRMTDDHLLMEGPTSKQKFGSYTLHVEFRLAYQPLDRGQARSNSGVYMQGRYEIQVLDSFGLEGKNNECGAIYSIRKPDVNMCFPPLAWQTYDVDYKAAEYDGSKKIKDAVITVRHNGVVVQHDVEIPHATTAAPVKEGPEPGPIYLQNHGNPVRFRNVWIVEKK